MLCGLASGAGLAPSCAGPSANLSKFVSASQQGDFPLGTFLINVSGAFVIGYLSILLTIDWRDRFGTAIHSGILTGLLGGYTTFSSMQLDAVKLTDKGKPEWAAAYLAISVVIGLIAAGLGAAIAHLQAGG